MGAALAASAPAANRRRVMADIVAPLHPAALTFPGHAVIVQPRERRRKLVPMTEPPVTFQTTDGVGWITLNRPAVLNALSTELVVALADCAARAAADAAGTVGEAFYRHWNRALDCLEDMPKVTLAVLHGYSSGGGLQLALACDLRVASDDAVIGLGATRHGLVPDGAVLRLARIVGEGRAKELALL